MKTENASKVKYNARLNRLVLRAPLAAYCPHLKVPNSLDVPYGAVYYFSLEGHIQ